MPRAARRSNLAASVAMARCGAVLVQRLGELGEPRGPRRSRGGGAAAASASSRCRVAGRHNASRNDGRSSASVGIGDVGVHAVAGGIRHRGDELDEQRLLAAEVLVDGLLRHAWTALPVRPCSCRGSRRRRNISWAASRIARCLRSERPSVPSAAPSSRQPAPAGPPRPLRPQEPPLVDIQYWSV